MEKLGISSEELKKELSAELTRELEKRTSLVKTGGEFSDECKSSDARVAAIKARMEQLETGEQG